MLRAQAHVLRRQEQHRQVGGQLRQRGIDHAPQQRRIHRQRQVRPCCSMAATGSTATTCGQQPARWPLAPQITGGQVGPEAGGKGVNAAEVMRAWPAALLASGKRPAAPPTCPMTQDLFRQDAYLRECSAHITAVTDAKTGIVLDQTVFYPWAAARPVTAACWCWQTAPDHHCRHPQGQRTPMATPPATSSTSPPRAGRPRGAAHARYGRHRPHRLGAPPPHDAPAHHQPPAVPCGAAAGQRLLHHARLRAAGLCDDRPAGQGAAHRRHRHLVAAAHPLTVASISDEELDANPALVKA